jgi:hypothetical protein
VSQTPSGRPGGTASAVAVILVLIFQHRILVQHFYLPTRKEYQGALTPDACESRNVSFGAVRDDKKGCELLLKT